ncbi:MAG: (2Fe-2S)-binding protein [Candidatus Thiodiazotropha sp.]
MFKLIVNGITHPLDLDPQMPLLWVLRDHLGLTGTKYACGVGQCGSCTIYLDGIPARACQIPLEAVAGKSITTIEGLDTPSGRAVQTAWRELEVVQCGFCQSGQILSAAALLNETRQPTDEQIDTAMQGNLCRCATYARIRKAIHRAARLLHEADA